MHCYWRDSVPGQNGPIKRLPRLTGDPIKRNPLYCKLHGISSCLQLLTAVMWDSGSLACCCEMIVACVHCNTGNSKHILQYCVVKRQCGGEAYYRCKCYFHNSRCAGIQPGHFKINMAVVHNNYPALLLELIVIG